MEKCFKESLKAGYQRRHIVYIDHNIEFPKDVSIKYIRLISFSFLARHWIAGLAPEYLVVMCRPVNSSSGRKRLRSATHCDLIVGGPKVGYRL